MPESTTLTGSRPVAGVSVLLPSNCSAPEPSNRISPRLAVRCGLQACKPERRDKLTEATDPQGNRRPFAAGGAAPYLSFVVPVYGSPESLEPLAQRVKDVCAGMGVSYELILVDDRCPKNSWLSIKRLAEDDHAIVGISLSRNFGQHAAIQAGLSRVRGEWVVVMDCDLQDRPEEVPKLWAKALEGFDVVRAKRANRSDPLVSTIFLQGLLHVPELFDGYPSKSSVFQLWNLPTEGLSRSSLNGRKKSKYFPAIVSWIGFSQSVLEVNRMRALRAIQAIHSPSLSRWA